MLDPKNSLSFLFLLGSICSGLTLLIFWFGVQPFFTNLVIYTDGIKIRTPYWSIKNKFLPWDTIKNIEFYGKNYLGSAHKINSYSYYKIDIFLKNHSKKLEISELWVINIQPAYEIMKKYIKLFEKSKICKYHTEIKSDIQCRSCGDYVCNACIEKKELLNVEYYGCSVCLFNLGVKRIKRCYFSALIGPLLFLIFFIINTFSKLGNNLMNVIYVFSFIITIPFVILLAPYGYGFFLANIKRKEILKKLDIEFQQNIVKILSPFTFLINVATPIFFITIFFLLFPETYTSYSIIFLSIYSILTIIITKFSYYWEKPRKIEEYIKPVENIICPNCKKESIQKINFCPYCGKNLKDSIDKSYTESNEDNIRIEEETKDILFILRDNRNQAKNHLPIHRYFIIIELFLIFFIIIVSIILDNYITLSMLIFLGPVFLITYDSFLFYLRDSKSIQKLIINEQDQKIIYFTNYLKPINERKECDLKSLKAIEVRYYQPSYEIFFQFLTHKFKIFSSMGKEKIIPLCRKLLKYLNVPLIEGKENRIMRTIEEKVYSEFISCLYCGAIIQLNNDIKYCVKCGKKI